MRPVGTSWLLQHYGFAAIRAAQTSMVSGRRQTITKPNGAVEEYFPKNYWPGGHPLDHVEFIFKYESLSLDLLEQVFRRLKAQDIERYIAASPTSKYRRKIGFLYEFLTPHSLEVTVSGNYVPVLDPVRYYTGKPIRNARWRVVDNLLGGAGTCILIRRTKTLDQKLAKDWPAEIRSLINQADPKLWARAVSYLYLKETKASFAIENEDVSPARGERFIAVLEKSGRDSRENLLDEKRLTRLQNLIVDPRYAAKGFRNDQNYVGQTLPGFQEKVHYICPPPNLIRTLIAGLKAFCRRSEELSPPLRAAVVSFGFVYIHPFSDGNGRLHRLLLHESLAMDKYVDAGTILPFSAAMLRDQSSYDRVLETVSNAVSGRVQYHLERDGTVVLQNAREAEGVWRFPDLTPHVEYVLDLIETTVTRDLPNELDMLVKIDRAATAIKEIVDLPNQKLNLLLTLLLQNHGILSNKKRISAFAELTDNEVKEIQEEFAAAFGETPP